MPIAIATCWLPATARMAMPLRDLRKNHPKPPRNTRLTAPPSSWMGGMNRGPRVKGSSRIGSASGLVPAPRNVGPMPLRMEASPIVAMTTAMTGRPISFRSVTRSSAKPNPTMTRRPSVMASHSGAPHTSRLAATTRPAIITNSPWAKFTASVALYTSTKPSAISAYISPMRIPLDSNPSRKPRSSPTGGHSLDVLDQDAGLDGRLAAVLVGDDRAQLDLLAARVERLDHRRVLVCHEASPDLPRPRNFCVVGVQVLGQQKETPYPRGFR